MVCPHCGQYITVNDAQIVYPGAVNPAAANPLPAMTFYPFAPNACAAPPQVTLHNFTVGG